jgi:hypothetical protein
VTALATLYVPRRDQAALDVTMLERLRLPTP